LNIGEACINEYSVSLNGHPVPAREDTWLAKEPLCATIASVLVG
jgi:hypothetical protein